MTKPINSTLSVDSPRKMGRRSRRRLLAACLILGVAALSQSARSQTLVGEWLSGAADFTDVSGYSATGTHDGSLIGAGNFAWTADVPNGMSGQALSFTSGDTGLSINNSSTNDTGYVNTFDQGISNAFTVSCWAKGLPGGWNPFVSKYGEGPGWQLRVDGSGIGTFTVRGTGANDDMEGNIGTSDGLWHLYVGVYSSVTGVRSLYVDGLLAAQETNNGPYNLAVGEHLCIGAKDQPSTSPPNYCCESTMEMYDVRIYNSALSSNDVQALYPQVAPTVGGQAETLYAIEGKSAQVSFPAIGYQPLGYQWLLNNVNLTNGASFTNVTGSALTILNVSQADEGSYTVIVSDAYGHTNSPYAVTLIVQPPALVGEWLAGATNLTDVSTNSLAGMHEGVVIGGGNYYFTNDVPLGRPGQSLYFWNGDTGIAITNTSALDSNYDDSFDTLMQDAFSVTCWAKGFPGSWNPWVSKFGEGEAGWQLRDLGYSMNYSCFTVRDNGSGSEILGQDGGDDMGSGITSNDGKWHHYAGVFSAGTGVRSLYVDGVLAAQETGNVACILATNEHVCIGAKDQPPGDTYCCESSFEIYDVRIYNYDLTSSEVQALVALPSGIKPELTGQQPAPVSVYAGGTVYMGATGILGSAPLSYQWQLNSANLTNGANIAGALTPTLAISNVSLANVGTYQLLITNPAGSLLSSNATLQILTPPVPGSYDAQVLAYNPYVYWKLNETNDPSSGGVFAYESISGMNGTYGTNAENGFNDDSPGPQGLGFLSPNWSLTQPVGPVADSFVGVSTVAPPVASGNVTYAMWINPSESVGGSVALIVDRSAPPGGEGFGFTGASGAQNANGMTSLGYWWNENNGDTWDFKTGLFPPVGQWSFVALVISPTGATFYMINSNGVQTAINPISHDSEEFGNTWHIGSDEQAESSPQYGGAWRAEFPGSIADVSIFTSSLSSNQIVTLYNVGIGIPTLTAQVIPGPNGGNTGGSLVLTWSAGNLFRATNLTGPWAQVNGTSPYTNIMTGPSMFFKAVNP
ncbi:MAG: LamG-like jellyroll fold domain-containing protein [Verrucomicrobiota bacterium]